MAGSPNKLRQGFPKGGKGGKRRSWTSSHPQHGWARVSLGRVPPRRRPQGVHTPWQHLLSLRSCDLALPEEGEPQTPPALPIPVPAGSLVPGPRSALAAEVRSSRTHSWFSILCISSLILMAVVSSSSSSSGFREASLSDSEVSSSLTCLRSRFRPTEAGTLTGDKCRDYRNEAGSKVGSR